LLIAVRKSFMQWLILVGVGLVLLMGGLFAFSPIVRIREIRVVRTNARLDIEEVQHILAPLFGRHLFFLPEYEVTNLLKDALSDLQEVEVSKRYPSLLHVRIALDPIVARLRILSPEDAADPQDYTGSGAGIDFLTERGIYIVAPMLEVPVEIPTINLVDWGVRPEPGTELLIPEFLDRIAQTERALLQQFGHHVQATTVYLRAQEYHLQIDQGRELWFDTASTMDKQLLRYRTFLRNVPLDSVQTYVDLRLTDRVIYK